MGKFIVIDNNGEVFSHFPDLTGAYGSLCGLDGDDPDPAVNQRTISCDAEFVDCPDCIAIFDLIQRYSEKDIQR